MNDNVEINILLINDFFLPGYKGGGPIKSVANLSVSLTPFFNKVTILTRDRDLGDVEKYENIKTSVCCKVGVHNVIYESNLNFLNILRHIKNEKINLIWVNSFFSIYSIKTVILKKLNFINAVVIISPRGEVSKGGFSLKSTKKKLYVYACKFMNLYSDVIFHTTDESESIYIHKVLDKKSFCLPNLSTSFNTYNSIFKKTGSLRVVFLSRISQKKNLLTAIKIIKLINIGEVIFDIYGPPEDERYLKKCKLETQELPLNVTIRFMGGVEFKEVPYILSRYHVFLLPTLNENYGHAIVEAMLSGVIPVISNNTPWKDLQRNNAGWDLDLANLDKFSGALREVMVYNNDKFREASSCVVKYISQRVNNLENISKYKEFVAKVTSKD
jgi:glycosyltransferase involved in cell wall biosynthesis